MLETWSKNGMYKTTDAKPRDNATHGARLESPSLLSSFKAPGKSSKNISRPRAVPGAKQPGRKAGDQNPQVWHLATFSSPEQLAKFKEKQDRIAHEAMLSKELAKFRAEVEDKFRKSATNQQYAFPRTVPGPAEVSGERATSARVDFAVTHADTLNEEEKTHAEPEVVHTARNHHQKSSGTKGSSTGKPEEYFATTCTLLTRTVEEGEKPAAKVASRGTSGNGHNKSTSTAGSSAKFFTKIQTLIRPVVQSRRVPSEDRKQPKQADLASIRGALMKTIDLQASGLLGHTKGNSKRPVAAPAAKKDKNESSSVDSKAISTSQSESKLIKSNLTTKKSHVETRKTTGVANQLMGTQKVKSSKLNSSTQSKPRPRPMAGSRIRSRVQLVSGKSKEQSSVDTSYGRHETSGSAVRGGSKNPEYFELQRKATAEARGTSPASRDVKVSFNIRKILATLKAEGRSSGSRLKGKASPAVTSQSKGRFRHVASANKTNSTASTSSAGGPGGKGGKSATKTRPMVNAIPEFTHTLGFPKGP